MVRRNVKTHNSQLKTRAYNTLVRPVLEYSATVWDPYTQADINKLQQVQRRAARYVTHRFHNTSSPTAMLEELGWEDLEARRKKMKLCMFYKIHHHLVNIQMPQYIHPASIRARRTHNLTYFEIPTMTDYYRHSFFPSTVILWNNLPAEVVTAPTLEAFKSHLAHAHF
jgi:hypothetical protein